MKDQFNSKIGAGNLKNSYKRKQVFFAVGLLLLWLLVFLAVHF
jgi:hypothetical protein